MPGAEHEFPTPALRTPRSRLKEVQRPPSLPIILSQGVGEWGDAAKDENSSGRCALKVTGHVFVQPELFFGPA